MKLSNMKLSKITFPMIAAVLVFMSCSKKVDETQKATEDATNAMQQMSQNTATGTTADKKPGVAIPAKTLAAALPTISGYTPKGEAETMEMEMAGAKYSHANQDYENGEKNIKVSIMDYNYIAGLSMAYSTMMNMSMETNEESMHSEKFNGNPGWINWKKKSNEGTVGVIVNDRVYVTIEARDGATLDEIKSVAGSINYSVVASAAK